MTSIDDIEILLDKIAKNTKTRITLVLDNYLEGTNIVIGNLNEFIIDVPKSININELKEIIENKGNKND